MKHLFFLLSLLLTGGTLAAAEDKAPQNEAGGTWSWSYENQNGETVNSILKLKHEGEKLTGTVTGRGGTEMAIEEGTVKNGEVNFRATRERNGNKVVTKYTGKIQGDTLKGKIETDFNGETRSRDWEARRGVPKVAAKSATGTWTYSIKTTNGQTLEPILELKQEAEKLTGTMSLNDNKTEISEGSVKDDQVTFKVVRKRDDRTITTSYKGKLEGNSIKGEITSNWGGNDRTSDFEARRQ